MCHPSPENSHFARWGPFRFPISLRARGRSANANAFWPSRLPSGARLPPQALPQSLIFQSFLTRTQCPFPATWKQ